MLKAIVDSLRRMGCPRFPPSVEVRSTILRGGTTLSHRLRRCQLPDAKTQFVASLRCEKLLVVLMSLCDGREHIEVKQICED